MLDLGQLQSNLGAAAYEAQKYGLSKTLRDRLEAAAALIPVLEAEREKRS